MKCRKEIAAVLCLSLFHLCFLAGCAPSPDNAQIEAAIKASLSGEATPPMLDFGGMEVPMRESGKAGAVLWTADGETQRNYVLEYESETRTFAVTSFKTYRKGEDGTYFAVPNSPDQVPTELASCFDFSDDFSQQYLLLYAGEGDNLGALRRDFESGKLSAMSAGQLSDFETCDLGGNTLVLLVPRYKGMSVWINELEHQGDLMITGEEIARFGDRPLYIFCSFDDMLPQYEIHVNLGEQGEFFLTREALLEYIK